MKNAAQAYFKTGVTTVDQGQLLIMLYDGALRFLAKARQKILEKNYAEKGILISRVLDIITELSSSLNMNEGGELSENLRNLYFLCTTRLLQANLKMDVEPLDSVVNVITGLRDAYAEVLNRPEARAVLARIESRMKPAQSLQQQSARVSTGTAARAGNMCFASAHAGAMPSSPALDKASQIASLGHTVLAAADSGTGIQPGFVTEQIVPHISQSTVFPPAETQTVAAAVGEDTVGTPAPAAAPAAAAPQQRGFAGNLAAYRRFMKK